VEHTISELEDKMKLKKKTEEILVKQLKSYEKNSVTPSKDNFIKSDCHQT
jgi:hypothetical protein